MAALWRRDRQRHAGLDRKGSADARDRPTALPFISFFPAVAWTAWYGGLRPAALSILIAMLAADWFFFEPLGGLAMDEPVALLAFPVACLFIVGAIEVMHRARARLVREIAERVRAEAELAHSRDLTATTLASIGDGVIVTDADGNVTFLNAEAERLTGWGGAEAAGRPLPEVFRIVNEVTREPVESPVEKVLRLGTVAGLANHTVLITKRGEERSIDDSAAPIRDRRGEIVGAVLVFRDVTERRRAEQELRASREKLREQAEQLIRAHQRKNEFLATLAHELRNPLAPIKNSITVLQVKGPADPELVRAREVIARQVQLMARLLDDLLDVNRLGRHKLDLRKETVTLAAIIESAVESARPFVTSGRHALSIDLPGEAVVLDADPIRLAQVFANLLNNAAKYMDEGGRISLTGARVGDYVVVSVKDSGIGIAAEALPGLFEMFSQVPRSLERSQGGVGVGLSLAKGLVELHGGTIEARSDGLGKGSEFVVRLPVAVGVQAPPPPVHSGESIHPTNSVKRRILIADDHEDNADTLAMMLRVLGHDVHAVYDGERAVETAAELRPEVVLLDIGMPRLNGYDTCRRIRAHPWGRSMFLIAQTGWGQEVDRRRAEEAGFDHHMLKPVDVAALVVVLADVPSGTSDGEPRP